MGEKKGIEVKKENEGKEQKSRELTIKRENPFSLFQKMDQYFNDLTRGFFNDWYWPFRFMRSKPLSLSIMESEPFFRTPLANVVEDEENFNIVTEMPGLDKGDIKITIRDGNLEIKGEIKEEKKEEKEGELVRKEYRSSNYYRCFSLPENIDEEKIDASLDKGILTVKIPKKEPEKKEKREIEIK